MITLICTKCKATLEMDDAFAGGVCRCQYCGTIQTVPSHLKQSSRGAGVGAVQKALYSTKAASGAGLPSSGLDELANVVASSGLASGLANRVATPSADRAQPMGRPPMTRTPLMIGAGALVAVLIGVIIVLLASRSSNTPPTKPPVDTGPKAADLPSQRQENRNASSGPQFLDIPIHGTKVIYLLDRGQSSRDVLDDMKEELQQSLKTLGADREFEVFFWTAPGVTPDKPEFKEYSFPADGRMAKANEDRIELCRKKFEDLTASGRTDIAQVATEAMKRNPQVIFLVTAKGINLDDSTVKAVEKARAGKPVIVHTVDLTSSGDGASVLQAIAQKTGGIYKHIPPHELRNR